MDTATKTFRKRNAILSYLQNTCQHPSAEMIYTDLKSEIPDLSIGTVYRNLNLFKQQGLVTSVATVKGVERFDACTASHVHFICGDCGTVADLPQIQVPDTLNQEVTTQTGGSIDLCQLTFVGRCSQCIAENQEGGEAR